jgi:hypothetical protein
MAAEFGTSGTIYDSPPARSITFAVGSQDLNEQLGAGFQAAHVWVNNHGSNQYLWLPDAPDIVPPGATRIIALRRTDVARASWTIPAPFAISQPATPAGAAILTFVNAGIDMAPSPGLVNVLASVLTPILFTQVDGTKATYRSVVRLNAAAAAKEIWALNSVPGGKIIRLTRLTVTIISSAAGQNLVALGVRTSGDLAGGISTNVPIVQLDQADPLPTAVATQFAGVPNHPLGNVTSYLGETSLFCAVQVSAVPSQLEIWEFGNRPGAKAVVLNPAKPNNQLVVDLLGGTIAGNAIVIESEHTEE